MTIVRHDADLFSLSMRSDRAAVFVRLAGDVDLNSVPAMADAVGHLSRRAPDLVYIDLAEVSFACSTLINFVAQVVGALPSTSTVVLCRPRPATVALIRLFSIQAIAELRDDLPGGWPHCWTTDPMAGGATVD